MKSTQRIGLLLAVVFLIPALFFSVYEISSLNKDEKMIEGIYEKQLEAILFSVNQYSDDVVNSWITKIESGLQSDPRDLENFLSLNSMVAHIFVADTINGVFTKKIYPSPPPLELTAKIDSALLSSDSLIRKLVAYKISGFRKVDILKYPWNTSEDVQCLVFISDGPQTHRVFGLLINREQFVQEIVGPRLQVIAKDQFVLSAFRKNTAAAVYSTSGADSVTVSAEALTRDFWLLPDYSIGIRSRGPSMHAVVRERTYTNLAMLVALDAVLIVALILVYRNVKKEVQLAQSKSEFVSNVSHEIRTPLALISMFAETLEMGRVKSDEKRNEYYQIINKETRRLSDIVNKILNFSRTESSQQKLNIQPLHPVTSIREILATYDVHLKNKGFEYTLKQSGDVWVKADKEAFVEIFINLLDNAMKYSADNKRIEILVDADNHFGIVVVKDYGLGISNQDQKHIFDKFYRVSTGDLAKSRGTGLGLSLVKQLMDAHQGKVSVHSRPGVGSSFTLSFPIASKPHG